VWIVT